VAEAAVEIVALVNLLVVVAVAVLVAAEIVALEQQGKDSKEESPELPLLAAAVEPRQPE